MSETRYYFISSVRQGLSTVIQGVPSEESPYRPRIDVKLLAEARKKDTTEFDSVDIDQPVSLYGPGDILGFHERVITRLYPQPDVGDFEPNYFPSIEFADPDFAWRFTVNKADADGKLSPWITLIILVSENHSEEIQLEFESLPSNNRGLPPAIRVDDSGNLPDLDFAWRWAHTHVTNEAGKVKADLESSVRNEPEQAICRLVCPRRLAPGVRYRAFVVPTFEIGRRAGRGEPLDNINASQIAWNKSAANPVELPYYFSWEFRTGLRGDFEHLVRLLEPRELTGLGLRKINCSSPGFGVSSVNRESLDDIERPILEMEGALRSLDTQYTEWGRDPEVQPFQGAKPLQDDLALLLNKPRADVLFHTINLIAHDTDLIKNIRVAVPPYGLMAIILWDTEETTTTHLLYGEFDPPANEESLTGFRAEHQVRVNLKPGITYYFKIIAQTEVGLISETSINSFTMPPLPSVLPPIYGRWHRGRNFVSSNPQEEWLDVLNLDPRHRSAAGLGLKVIRKQQEPLMASAWDQLGAIESANDILRRSQFGRQTLLPMYQRLQDLPFESFIHLTAPVHSRIVIKDENDQNKSIPTLIKAKSYAPDAALDPSLRRIMRARGPIRKRQMKGRTINIFERLAKGSFEAAGPAPKPLGTFRMCDITGRLENDLKPKITVFSARVNINGTEATVTLTWATENTIRCIASGAWNGEKAPAGTEQVGPFTIPTPGNGGTVDPGSGLPFVPVVLFFTLSCEGPAGSLSETRMVSLSTTPGTIPPVVTQPDNGMVSTGYPGETSLNADHSLSLSDSTTPASTNFYIRVPVGTEHLWILSSGYRIVPPPILTLDTKIRFCDGNIKCEHITSALNNNSPFEGIDDVPDPDVVGQTVCDVLNDWLDKGTAREDKEVDEDFINNLKQLILPKLDPNITVVDRTKKRLRLSGQLAARQGDPLDQIMFAPYFPQPMYEPLRDISHDLLLPGVEKIPQNTIGLLCTNRRFLESYMCGLVHEFAGELLWRGYPTDQRGSYFQQFWDVSGYVMRPGEIVVLAGTLSDDGKADLIRLNFDIAFDLLREKWLKEENVSKIDELPDDKKNIISKIQNLGQDAISDIPNAGRDYLSARLLKAEELKDIKPLVKWKENKLSENANRSEESIVLVVRGDLLKRYPNALIYAIDGIAKDGENGEIVPGLPEYLDEGVSPAQRIFPIFKATLPPDLTFFGFPFADATGKYFVIEEQMSEPRFGLDIESDILDTWDALAWSNFGLTNSFGLYIDDSTNPDPTPTNDNGLQWNDNSSSAVRACITMQKPVRIAVHADEMLPDTITSC